jgi:two-component system, LuxR family, response regulator FixJ
MTLDPKTQAESPDTHQLVYIVDDSADVREVIKVLLSSVNLKSKTFPSGEAFLAAVDLSARGCLLLDLRMPGMSGLEVQDALKARSVTLPIIFLTGHGEVNTAVRAMRDGALDYIEKPFQPQFLLDRIHACLKRDSLAHAQQRSRLDAINRLSRLTPRETEIAEMIVAGMPSKKIAVALNLSEKTVDVHRHNIIKKVSAGSVAELVKLWLDARAEGN